MSDTGEASGSRRRSLQPQQAAEPGRRVPEAASVDRRWWEEGAALESPLRPQRSQADAQAGRLLQMPPTPPPPPPPAQWTAGTAVAARSVPPLSSPPGWSGPAGAAQLRTELLVFADVPRIQHLEQQLEALREEAAALHELLEDLPEIYERKFRQRLQGILEQQQLLLEDNHLLREQLYALLPLVAAAGARPSPSLPSPVPPSAESPPLRTLLQSLGRLGSGLGPASWSATPPASPAQPAAELSVQPDDEPPKAASAAPRRK